MALVLGSALAGGGCMTTAGADPPSLSCRLEVESPRQGGPAPLRLYLANPGSSPVHVLVWGTPFEGGWLGTLFAVSRNGEALPFQGRMVKRGDPETEEYVTVPAGGEISAASDLALVYDLGRPGRYEVTVAGDLHDATSDADAVPRPRQDHEPLALDCPPVSFELTP